LDFIQVANFCSAEDDGSFWSRWIKPDAVAEAEVCISFVEFDLRFYR
jgi:chromodomain-helicase-DNA-binding protein 1